MKNNIFEELQAKKKNLIALVEKAVNYGWIDNERAKGFIDKLNNDTLTIGVIGQMKCGKSTFLNAFVFEDDVLPAATTPMTAALSVITYGEEKKIVAEFYSKDEWAEQKLQASRNLDDVSGNTLEESKIQAAKELVGKSAKLGASLNSLLGKTQTDSFDNLIEYVGADGKYVSITKSVTIYYPKEYLKGVEVVDTPGFNDPIVSREERTKEFLKKADVVLLMLYAGRPFDATDRDILFKNVRQCGIGKVLVGINKYDLPYESGETEEEIRSYVINEIDKACRECDDNTLVDILKETSAIPLSAEMALLSEIPMSKIGLSDEYTHAWNRHCETFEISTQQQMAEKSHLSDLVNAIRKIIETEKENILFAKPLNAIRAAGKAKQTDIEKDIEATKMLIDSLNQPDDELEDRIYKLKKAHQLISNKIESLGKSIENEYKVLICYGGHEMEDAVEKKCTEWIKIINNKGIFTKIDKIKGNIDYDIKRFAKLYLKRYVEDLGKKASELTLQNAKMALDNINRILLRYMPKEIDLEKIMLGVQSRIDFSIKDLDIFNLFKLSTKKNFADIIVEFFLPFLSFNSYNCDNLREAVEKINLDFKPEPFLNSLFSTKENVLESIKTYFIDEFLNPLIQELDDIQNNIAQREDRKKAEEKKLTELKAALVTINQQMSEI